jgi:hypothetical protein
MAKSIFGNCTFAHDLYISNMNGGAARLARKFPLGGLTAMVLKQFREICIVSVKR